VSDSVSLFSADDLRGKIIQKVLNRNGLECRIFTRILEAGGTIAQQSPKVVILDTESCFSEELNHLRNLCHTLKNTVAIVLGESVVLDGFKCSLFRKTLCLPDPLNPELIAMRVKEVVSQKSKTPAEKNDSLENTLKRFLNLA
jgi:DNA-binding response OmpR family regulator